MTFLKHTKLVISGLVLGLITANTGYAESQGSNNYINLAIGIEDFDNDRQLDSEDFFSLGFEHRYDGNWAVEVFAIDSSPRPKGGGSELDLSQFGIDALYYFDQSNPDSNIQPYGAFGLGLSEFETDTDDNEEGQARVGLGLRYLLGDHWSLRGDTRLLWSEESHTTDNTISIGLSFAFSPQKKAKPAPVVVKEPEPEPDSDGDGVYR